MFVSVHHICLHLNIYSYSCVNNTSDDHASICNLPHNRDQSLTKNSNHRCLQRISSQYKKKSNRTRKLLCSTGAKSGVSGIFYKMSSHVLTDSSTWNVNDRPVDKSAICLATCLPVYLSVCLSVRLLLFLSFISSLCLSFHPSFCLFFLSLLVCFSVCPLLCLSFCLLVLIVLSRFLT